MTTQGIETGTAETEGLGAKHESPVGAADAQNSAATPPLAVTDADRSEAADLLLIVGFSLEYIAETKAGSHDDHAFVQAFARHRLATQTPNAAALVGALDLAKRMAESVGLDWSKLPDQPDAACGYGMPEGCKSYWLRLAALSSTPSNTQGALDLATEIAAGFAKITGAHVFPPTADHWLTKLLIKALKSGEAGL